MRVEVPEGTRVADVLEQLSLGSQQRVIVGVNGQTVPPEQELTEGARIDLLSPMAGGSLARGGTYG